MQVNIRVDEEQKEAWEAFVEESGRFSSLTGLIRAGVESEMKKNAETPESTPPALTNDLQKILDRLDGIESDIAWLRRQEQDDVVMAKLTQDVFEALEPLHPQTEADHVPENVEMNLEDYQQFLGAKAVIEPSGDDDERSPQTANALADRLGVETDEVEDAIDHLQDQFLPVVEVEYQGQVHYFKEA